MSDLARFQSIYFGGRRVGCKEVESFTHGQVKQAAVKPAQEPTAAEVLAKKKFIADEKAALRGEDVTSDVSTYSAGPCTYVRMETGFGTHSVLLRK